MKETTDPIKLPGKFPLYGKFKENRSYMSGFPDVGKTKIHHLKVSRNSWDLTLRKAYRLAHPYKAVSRKGERISEDLTSSIFGGTQ